MYTIICVFDHFFSIDFQKWNSFVKAYEPFQRFKCMFGFFFKNLILLLFSYYTRLPVLPYCKQAGAAKTVANLLVNVEILL